MKINKSYLKSKTLWVSLFMALAPLFPSVQEFITANPSVTGMVVGSIFGLLRIKTDSGVVLKEDKLK